MITSLSLINFRKHKNLNLEFTKGFVCLKGANEAGKSSINEAIQYAIFGSGALRTTFAEAVAHGFPEISLKVECGVQLADRALTFKRSKSGAEVIENGAVIVTGQKECALFAANLMGADMAAAMNLMVANQGSLRGVLEQGPKNTSVFVENLANFDLFDNLIERMQAGLMLGNTSVIEAEVSAAQEVLTNTTAPIAPDFTALQSAVADATAAHKEAEAAYPPFVGAVAAAKTILDTASNKVARHNTLQHDLDECNKRIARIDLDKADAEATVATSTQADYAEIDRLKEALSNELGMAVKARAYAAVAALPKLAVRWEGDRASLARRIKCCDDYIRDGELRITKLDKQQAVLRSTLVTSSICGFCKQDFSQWPDVAKKNAETEAAIAEIMQAMDVVFEHNTTARQELSELREVLAEGQIFEKCMADAEWVHVDDSTYPPRITWKGEVPVVGDTVSLRTQLATHEAKRRVVEAAASHVEAYAQSIAREKQHAINIGTDIAKLGDVSTEYNAAFAEYQAAEQRRIEHTVILTEKSGAVWTTGEALRTATETYSAAKASYDAAEATLKSRKVMLDNMQFNNALLKKVRLARPIVSDKLWGTVLHSVSSMFTRMRGELSTVTKDKDGFKVNGQSVESLSGSTLDILALSIRVSLVKVFLPNSNFLMLDEASSGCDDDRSAVMYGFLKSAGFDQVLLVTHDSLAEAISDQLLEI